MSVLFPGGMYAVHSQAAFPPNMPVWQTSHLDHYYYHSHNIQQGMVFQAQLYNFQNWKSILEIKFMGCL